MHRVYLCLKEQKGLAPTLPQLRESQSLPQDPGVEIIDVRQVNNV